MGIIFWLVVMLVAVAFKRRRRANVRLLYTEPGRIVGDYAVFKCGCSYAVGDCERRSLCAAHDTILKAAVAA